jgi:hypothetical protein
VSGQEGSGFGDRSAEALERDDLRLRTAALVGVQAVDPGELVVGELEVEDVEVLRVRCGLVDFGITERPCCRCQRSITWAGDLSCDCAIAPITGSSSVLPWDPSR